MLRKIKESATQCFPILMESAPVMLFRIGYAPTFCPVVPVPPPPNCAARLMMNAAPNTPAAIVPAGSHNGWSYDRVRPQSRPDQSAKTRATEPVSSSHRRDGRRRRSRRRPRWRGPGIGRFTIADPDTFDVAHTNRQVAVLASNFGKNKSKVMAEVIRQINPDAQIRVFDELIGPDNVDEFLDGADLFVDGIDAFEADARRLLFQKANQKGIWSITAGPVGFSAVWITFDPAGMSFDLYFDLNDQMDAASGSPRSLQVSPPRRRIALTTAFFVRRSEAQYRAVDQSRLPTGIRCKPLAMLSRSPQTRAVVPRSLLPTV